jgi:hypothetical protein
VFDSELWADLPVVQSLFNRGPTVQALRARLESTAALAEVKAFVAIFPLVVVKFAPKFTVPEPFNVKVVPEEMSYPKVAVLELVSSKLPAALRAPLWVKVVEVISIFPEVFVVIAPVETAAPDNVTVPELVVIASTVRAPEAVTLKAPNAVL